MTVWTEATEQTTSWVGGPHLSLPGEAGNYASTPDASVFDITGDIDLRVEVALADWNTLGQGHRAFIGKQVRPDQLGYLFNTYHADNRLRFKWSPDGTTANEFASLSTVAPNFLDGSKHWIRVTLDADNGSGGHDVTFYTSEDGGSWTQLGDVVTTAGVATLFNSTAGIEMGTTNNGADNEWAGKFYRGRIYDGINGTLVFDAQFDRQSPGATSFNESSVNAALVTINQSGSPQAEIISGLASTTWTEQTENTTIWTEV